MYRQTFDTKNMKQDMIDNCGALISAIELVDCSSEKGNPLVLNKDTRIFRGQYQGDIFFRDYDDKSRIFLIQLYGGAFENISTCEDSNLIGNYYHDDAPDKKGIIHADLEIKSLTVNGKCSLHNAEIEFLYVGDSGFVILDSPCAEGYCRKALVHGTLVFNGLIPIDEVKLAPGGRLRVWNINHEDDIKVRGVVRKPFIRKTEDGQFWYYG